jgi:hypothetical protein
MSTCAENSPERRGDIGCSSLFALHLDVALRSNDNDFEDARVEWFTTAELLKTSGIRSV